MREASSGEQARQGSLDLYRGPAGVSLAREAVESLAARQIPTHPANYEIWTTYKSGTHPGLNREIDRCIAAGESFTDEQNKKLFERFFASTRLSLQLIEAGDSAARELARVSSDMREVSIDAASFSASLNDATQQILSGMSAVELAAVLSQVASKTSAMALRNAKLSNALAEASRHIDVLQNELLSVRAQALIDSLTGLANRRRFDETLLHRQEEAKVEKTDLCLLLCDIDHFKGVNDRWGHTVGDQVIRFVAQSMQNQARSDWLVARHGGDEFAMVMPRTGLRAALEAAKGLNEAVRSKSLVRRSTGESLGQITVSIGVASYRLDECSEGLFERADVKLYEAKRRGRNQVCCQEQ
jgi:diguanylate cyclase